MEASASVAGAAVVACPNVNGVAVVLVENVDFLAVGCRPFLDLSATELSGVTVLLVAGVLKVKSDTAGPDVVVVETAAPVNVGAKVVVVAEFGCLKLNMDVAPVVAAGLKKDNDGVEVAPKENADGAAAAVVVAAGSSNVVILAVGCRPFLDLSSNSNNLLFTCTKYSSDSQPIR